MTRRVVALTLVAVALFAIGVPGVRAISYELERRSLVVERAVREAQLQLLNGDLETLTGSELPVTGE